MKELKTLPECYKAYQEFCRRETVTKNDLFEALDRVKIGGAELFCQRYALVTWYMKKNGIPTYLEDIRHYNDAALFGLLNEWYESRKNK